jgi:DNA-directed RNA polymerase subunit RPC12/RpoP
LPEGAAVAQGLDYKCPHCGGNLAYNAEAGLLVCDNCGSRFDPTAWQTPQQAQPGPTPAPEAEEPPAPWPPPQFNQYACRSCGAVVAAAATEAAGTCPYCRSPIVIAEQLAGELAPELVVPFRTTREQAVAALNGLYGKKRLLPKVFSAQNFIDEVKGVYVPFWLFDFETKILEQYDARDVSTQHWGNTSHTTTRHYAAHRVGEARFLGVPVDGSINMPDAIMESIEPFDLTRAVPFKPTYLPGFLAERYNVDSEMATVRARERLDKTAGSIFRNTVTGHQSVSLVGSKVTVNETRLHLALLPVWVLTTVWRGERFTFAMNGQTGRIVGDLPLDRAAYWRWFAILASSAAVVAGAIAALAVGL